MFDLSSLTLLGRSHQATVSPAVTDSAARSATFYVSVCWPLAQQNGIHCPPGAAVCRKDAANNFTVSRPYLQPPYGSGIAPPLYNI